MGQCEATDELFSKLLGTSSEADYSALADLIIHTQEEIIEHDDASKNKKGYSRLANICTHMLIQVVGTYLNDKNVSWDEKTQFDAILSKHLESVVNKLLSKLPRFNESNSETDEKIAYILRERGHIPTSFQHIVAYVEAMQKLVPQTDRPILNQNQNLI